MGWGRWAWWITIKNFDHGKFEMSGHPSREVGGWNPKPNGGVSLEFRSEGQHLVGI